MNTPGRQAAFWQLVRLPNLFTAAADPLAGWLLGGGTLLLPRHYVPLALTGAALYAGGMALNDLLDRNVDAVERPSRPLPSGRISIASAQAIVPAAFALGLGLALLGGGLRSLLIGVILVASIVFYDGPFKASRLGVLLMGACRALNLALGFAATGTEFSGGGAAVMVSYGIFVAGITWISRTEVEEGRPRELTNGAFLQVAGLFGLLASALRNPLISIFPHIEQPPFWAPPYASKLEAQCGVGLLALVAFLVVARLRAVLLDPVPARKQAAVRTGVLSLVWLNVGVVLAVRGYLPALAVAILWFPARWFARRISPT